MASKYRFLIALGGVVILGSAACSSEGDAVGDRNVKTMDPQVVTIDRDLAQAVADKDPFIAVYRSAEVGDLTKIEAQHGLPAGTMEEKRGFYLAIDRAALEQPWFLGATLRQFYQSNGESYLDSDVLTSGLYQSLGTRVVSFQVKAGKLFVFDQDPRKTRSDVLNPDVIVDAYPVITGWTGWDRIPGADRYVLVDPAAGLSRFAVEASASFIVPDAALAVDLSLVQGFRAIDDGITFEKVFSGSYQRQATAGARITTSRASGTLGLSLRRYVEGEGFAPKALVAPFHFFGSRAHPVLNEGRTESWITRWNIKPGMKPIKWLVTSTDSLGKAPATKDYDVYGAIKRGIESWNDVLGFPIFTVEKAGKDDVFGQDDKNFFMLDPDPRRDTAFADVRYNPNTGEIRGANVHFFSGFIDLSLGTVLPGQAQPYAGAPAPTPGRPEVTLNWGPGQVERLCDLGGQADAEAMGSSAATPSDEQAERALTGVAPKERVERMLSYWTAHEIGHTLGLRHNFRGSLMPPSSSVMDYVGYLMAAATLKPGSYDVAAMKHLYSQAEPPPQPFCTEGGPGRLSRCYRHDAGADPIKEFYGPRYAATLDGFLKGDVRALDRLYNPSSTTIGHARDLVAALRVPENADEALAAWDFATAALRPPLAQDKLADRAYGARVDRATALLLNSIFPASTSATPPLPLPPLPTLVAAIATTAKDVLLNPDGIRGYPTRRTAVDLLRQLQSLEGLKALRAARDALVQGKAALGPDDQLLTDDLLARVDHALSPYFDE